MIHPYGDTLSAVKKPPSLREMAFEAIKKGIMSNTLMAGRTYGEHVLGK